MMLLLQSSLLVLLGSLRSITASSSSLLSEDAVGLRGSFQDREGFECTIEGAGGQPACDAATASDGTGCVWCSLSTLGFCLSAAQAQQMKSQIPGLACDDDDKTDDDNAPAPDDDAAPSPDDDATPTPPDDDKTPDDDRVVPDDYWTCLKDYKTEKDCAGAGCVWCNGKTGYGVCMDKAAAEQANKSDFFTCEVSMNFGVGAGLSLSSSSLKNPFDLACLPALISSDEAECRATTDSEGQPCEWCNVSGDNLCLTSEQASAVKQMGYDCDAATEQVKEQDPYDTSCLAASLQGDEVSCDATTDADGQACKWCRLQNGQVNLCLTSHQAVFAEQIGADCNMPTEEAEIESKELSSSSASLKDPFDTTCLAASLSGDEAACKATMDSEGQPCEWCALSGGQANLCLNSEQASLAEQTGADCSTGANDGSEVQEQDPYDTSCLAASLQGDEASCEATTDADGQACEWCSLQSGQVNLCLTSEQAGIAEQIGADCKAAGEVKDQDPYDTSCLAASLQGDEASCEATTAADGQACEWCSLQSGQVNLCLTSEQAGIAEQIGADCGKEASDEVGIIGKDDEVGQCPLLECLKNFDSSDCGSHSCTWCVAKCGHGVCLDPKSVETIGNCPFFDCKGDVVVNMTPGEKGLRKSAGSKFTKAAVHEPFDPQCLTAGMTPPGSDDAEETCRGSIDTSGQACVWCDAAGVFSLCMSAEQASVAGQWLQCDGAPSIESSAAEVA